jgi:hypothetical protein
MYGEEFDLASNPIQDENGFWQLPELVFIAQSSSVGGAGTLRSQLIEIVSRLPTS